MFTLPSVEPVKQLRRLVRQLGAHLTLQFLDAAAERAVVWVDRDTEFALMEADGDRVSFKDDDGRWVSVTDGHARRVAEEEADRVR